ncbi:MAG: YeeE/YedE family protein [Candidatus Geothermincolia bacterium]
MMTGTYLLLAAASLLLGLGAGAVMHRSDYCLAGMFRDLFLFRRVDKLRTLVLLVGATMLLFEGARLLGLLPNYPFPLFYAPTAANLIGGVLFGVGMVLAGGCVVGTLYKMGAGSIVSATAFVGLIVGSAGYAEIHPSWAAFIKQTTFFPGRITLPQIIGVGPTVPVLLIAAAGGALLLRWRHRGSFRGASVLAGDLPPWRAALLLALISLFSAVVVGMPLGVTSSYAKIAGWAERLVFPGHVAQSAFFQAVPLHYRHPLTGADLAGGSGPQFDAIAAIQFPLVAGIVFGSAISALLLGEWHLRRNIPGRQLISAFTGGVVMGFASRMAPTCNVWHLLGGLPMLAASSFLFLAGLFPGAWLGGLLLTGLVLPRRAPAGGPTTP